MKKRSMLEKVPFTTPIPDTHISYKTWIEIDRVALEHNIGQYKSIIGSALFMPVIKSNAYGHGIDVVAQVCEQNINVDQIAVVSLSEALRLRANGIRKPIVVLSIIDASLELAIAHDIEFVVLDIHTAVHANSLAKKVGKKARMHVKVDTGLSRLGQPLHLAAHFVYTIVQLSQVQVVGIFTHFADSEQEDPTFANRQMQFFDEVIEQLENVNVSIPYKHSSCSAAISAHSKSHYTLARAGIGIYGLWPSSENKKATQLLHPQFSLKPVMTWKTSIIQLKEIPAGSFVGYDRTHETKRTTRIAVLPVGYWDGLDRGLSNKGCVLINNQVAPILGRIAMNLCMIDVTDVSCSGEDQVILLGAHPAVTAESLGSKCDTINYEIVTRINPLLPRLLV